jgi:hypothetical protein
MKTTHQSFSISFVCGPPGSGKSYLLTRDVIDRLQTSAGKVITNLPLAVDKVAALVAGKLGVESQEVAERIVLLDREQLVAWQDGRGGPWELREQADGSDFILDECHLFCSKRRKNNAAEWERWLGEVRHEGWRRVVFVTQDESKVGQPITAHAELRFELTNSERLRDPFLKIPLSYWYELIASFTREYSSAVVLTEYRRVKGRLREQHAERFRIDPVWFEFYRSYEATGGGAGTGEGGSRVVREFERRPALLPRRQDGRLTLPVWLWIGRVHWWRFLVAGSILGGMTWLCFAGGGRQLLVKWLELSRTMAAAQSNDTGIEKSPARDVKLPPAVGANPAEPEQVLPSPGGKLTKPPSPRAATMELQEALALVPDVDARSRLIHELEHVAELYRLQQHQAEQLQQQIDTQVSGVRCLGMDVDRVWFDGGEVCREGDTIYEGALAGRKVETIEFERRLVLLDDGTVIRLGGHAIRLPESSRTGGGLLGRAEVSVVRGHLSTVGARKPVGRGARGGTKNHPLGRPDASLGVRADSVGPGGSERDRRVGAGVQDNHDGGPGPAD